MFELSKRISSYLVRCGLPKKNEAISCILYVFLYFAGFVVSNSSSLFGRAIFLGIHISIFLSVLACMNYYFKEYLYD